MDRKEAVQKNIEICKKCKDISLEMGISFKTMYKLMEVSQTCFSRTERGDSIPDIFTYSKLLKFIETFEIKK